MRVRVRMRWIFDDESWEFGEFDIKFEFEYGYDYDYEFEAASTSKT